MNATGVLGLLPQCREAREWLLGRSARCAAAAEAAIAASAPLELVRKSVLFGDLTVAKHVQDGVPSPVIATASAQAMIVAPLTKSEVDAQLWHYAALTAPLRMTDGGYMLCMHSSDQAMQHALAKRLADSLRFSAEERVLWNRKAVDMHVGIGDVHFAVMGLSSGKCMLMRTFMLPENSERDKSNSALAVSTSSRRGVEVCVVSGCEEIGECRDVDVWARNAKVERMMTMKEENTCSFCVLREEPRCICANALQRKALKSQNELLLRQNGELMGWEQYVGVAKQLLDGRELVRERIELRGADGCLRMSRCRVKFTALKNTREAASDSAVAKDWLRSFAVHLSGFQSHPQADVKLINMTLQQRKPGAASLSHASVCRNASLEYHHNDCFRTSDSQSPRRYDGDTTERANIVLVREHILLSKEVRKKRLDAPSQRSNELRKSLDVHHAIKKRRPTKCPECSKEFSQRHHMMVHYRTVHLGEKPFACSQCEKRFTQRSNMLSHMHDVHENPEERLFHCASCGKGYKSKSKLRLHRCATPSACDSRASRASTA
uniref:C2H2-type domain-containing protein n=1 Tax=Erythrolobus australicus TaxID=1077150 RepID=A0A7S1TNT3_9RHOD